MMKGSPFPNSSGEISTTTSKEKEKSTKRNPRKGKEGCYRRQGAGASVEDSSQAGVGLFDAPKQNGRGESETGNPVSIPGT